MPQGNLGVHVTDWSEVRILPEEQEIGTQGRADLPLMGTCVLCGSALVRSAILNGRRLDLRGRKHCLSCRPHHPLRGPRRPVVRTARPKLCEGCGGPFPRRAAIDGTIRNLNNRRFCLRCSPFGQHNTSRSPIGAMSAADLAEIRRKKRNAKSYR